MGILFNDANLNKENLHPAYEKILKNPEDRNRAYLEREYKDLYEYLDENFLKGFLTNEHFISRLWELNLGYSIKGAKNLELIKPEHSSKYPDYYLKNRDLNQKCYIEATAFKPGEEKLLSCPISMINSHISQARDVFLNRDAIARRLLSSLNDKVKQYIGNACSIKKHKYPGFSGKGFEPHQSSKIDLTLPYVIAINTSGIPNHNNTYNIYDFIRPLFGLGNRTIKYDKKNNKVINDFYTEQNKIIKKVINDPSKIIDINCTCYKQALEESNKNETKILSNFFAPEENNIVSAVIISWFGLPYWMGFENSFKNCTVLIYNPNAVNKLANGFFDDIVYESI